MKNKSIKIIIAVVVVLVILAAVGVVGYDVAQKQVLIQESNKIAEMDITTEEIDMTIKSSGRYAKIEKAEKEYMNEFAVTLKEAMAVFTDESITGSLSLANYKADGPEFTKTKAAIADAKTKTEELITKLASMTEEEKMMEKIKSVEGLSEKDYELYRNLMLDDDTRKDLEEAKNTLEEAKVTFVSNLDTIAEVLNLLSENADKWTVTDTNIMFSNASLLSQYNSLVSKLK